MPDARQELLGMGLFKRSPAAPPHQTYAAPKLDETYFTTMLTETGWPLTEHNVWALQERVGSMFMMKANQLIPQVAKPGVFEQFARDHTLEDGGDAQAWAASVLRGLSTFQNGALLQYVHDLPERVRALLLKGGVLLDKDHDQPLPTMANWRK